MECPLIDGQITFLYTKNMAQSTAFYEVILHLPLVLDQGGCRIYQVVGQAYMGVCERPNADLCSKGVILTFVAQDVDGWYNYLVDRGVTFEKPPTINEAYGIYHCFARDPNGYLIEIQRFLDPVWNSTSEQCSME